MLVLNSNLSGIYKPNYSNNSNIEFLILISLISYFYNLAYLELFSNSLDVYSEINSELCLVYP